jgi:radical SAM superfamily enzyme YgiQ (UPF0313 family)
MEYRKIALVSAYNPESRGVNESTIYPPLGLACLGAVLEGHGLEVMILDAHVRKWSPDDVVRRLKRTGADLVGLSVNLINAAASMAITKKLTEDFHMPVVLGGPFATTCYKEIYRRVRPYCIVLGEGERTLLRICRGEKLDEIEGISYMDGDELKVNPGPTVAENLNELPLPSFHLLPSLKLYRSRARSFPVAPILTSRGCPFGCAYCNSDLFGRKFRVRSAEKIMEEIEMLVKNYAVRQIDIIDDNFTLDVERAEAVFDLLIKKDMDIRINLQNGVRADRLTRRLVKKMKRAGVYKAAVGVESGSESLLRKIGVRPHFSEIETSVEWFRDEGILVTAFFIIGFPDDTSETIEKTIEYAVRLNPEIAVFSRFIPLPGTPYYRQLSEKGLLRVQPCEGVSAGFFSGSDYFRHPYLTVDELMTYHRYAYRKFYLRASKISELLMNIRSFHELSWFLRSASNVVMGLGM